MVEEKLAMKKRERIYEEDEVTMALYETTNYIVGERIDDSSHESIEIDQSIDNSAQGPQRLLLLN